MAQSLDLIVPAKGSFTECIDVGYCEYAYEAEHGPEGVGIDSDEFFELNCPWIHEYDFDVEEDEEHGN